MKRVPNLRSDGEAEAFLDQDLSDLDFSRFVPARFEFAPKTCRLNMRLPDNLLVALKQRANAKGVPFTRYLRELIEQDVAKAR